MRKVLRIAAGCGLVLLGITGLILPVMPGWIFLIPGLVILSEHYPPAKRLVDWAKRHAEKAGEYLPNRRPKGAGAPPNPDAGKPTREDEEVTTGRGPSAP
jgi:uncharacterized membrane protein YbaN (DUF454 family)